MIFPLIFFNRIIKTRFPVRNVFLKPTDVIPHLMRNLEWLR
jgi:hypothetical protein